MSEFNCQVEVKEVLEDRDDSAKKELVGALINAIGNLGRLPALAQKRQIFHAIETILDHHVMDGDVLINEILPHVFNLLKEEVPKEEFYAVCMLNHIAKKCVESRKAMFDVAEYLMEQLKTNFKLFHDELFDIVDKYGDVLSLSTAPAKPSESDKALGREAGSRYSTLTRRQTIRVVNQDEKDSTETEKDTKAVTPPLRNNSSSSLLNLLPSVITRSLSSSSMKQENDKMSRSNSMKSSNSLFDLVLPSHTEDAPPPPDLPYEVLPDFIVLLRRKTDLHHEAKCLLKLLAASSGPDFDPDHQISVFLSNFTEWNERTKSKSSRVLRQMVKKCDSLQHVEALCQTDLFMTLVEVLHTGSLVTKGEALWIVQMLTSQPLFHGPILDSPVLNAIIDLLQVEGKVADISMEAFWTLELCCKEERLRDAIFQKGGMPGLIHVVRQLHIDDPEPLKILSFFTQDDAQKGEISEKNIISRVVNTLCDGSVEEQIQAQELLITLAKGVSVHHLTSAFMDSDALPVLLEMLKGKHKLKIKALRILRLLAKGHLMRRMIVDSDSGLATLVGMVKTGPDEIKSAAGRVLGLMISDPDTHQDILVSGLLHIVLAFITHDQGGKGKWDSDQNSYDTKLLSVEILSLFAANEETRETLSHTEINTHLKHLIHHETGILEEHARDLLKCMEGEGKMAKFFHYMLHRNNDD